MKKLVYTLRVVVASDVDAPDEIANDIESINENSQGYAIEKVEIMTTKECNEYSDLVANQKVN